MQKFGEWATIETAPKDGQDLILYMPWTGFVRTGRYRVRGNNAGYWSADFGKTKARIGEPTHWMPLPPPPETRSMTTETQMPPELAQKFEK